MNLKLLEPLKELFKDEVRVLGNSAGLVKSILKKHPFPGPGLAIRIVGNITKEKIKILQKADYIFIEQLIKYNLYKNKQQLKIIIYYSHNTKTYNYISQFYLIEYFLNI